MLDEQVEQKMHRIEEKAKELVREFFPVISDPNKGGKYDIYLQDLEVRRPPMDDLDHELDLKKTQGNLEGFIRGRIVIKDKKGKVVSGSDTGQKVNIVAIPYKTERGTYLWKGKEKLIWNQMRLKPGVYTYPKETSKGYEFRTMIMLREGKNIYFEFSPETYNLSTKIEDKVWNALSFFRILGISDADIDHAINNAEVAEKLFHNAANKNIDKDTERLWGLIYKWRVDYKGHKYPGVAQAQIEIREYFFGVAKFGETGKEVMRMTIGVASSTLTPEVLLATLGKIIRVASNKEAPDVRDDIRFQDVLDDEHFILYKIKEGLNPKYRDRVTDNLSKFEPGSRSPSWVLQSKNIQGYIRDFMSSGDIVDYTEQTNPLHLMAAARKVTQLGEGGVSNKTAEDETRNLQNTAFGKIDPVETPESGKIGLVNHLAQFATVDMTYREGENIPAGTIKSKYYVVKNGVATKTDKGTVQLGPMEEYDSYVAFHDPNMVKYDGNKIVIKGKTVPARYRGDIIENAPVGNIQYIDYSPHSVFNVSVAMIPFVNHNDGNRTLMGANMQKQAINLIHREVPLVQVATDHSKTETYEDILGKNYAFAISSKESGRVTSVEDKQIVVKTEDGKLVKHRRYNYFPLNMSNFINNEPVVKPGDTVKKGDLLAEGWQTRNGKLAIGANVRVAYMPWHGYNFEDGVVVSRSLADRLVSEELKEIQVELREDQVAGPGSNIKQFLLENNVPPQEVDKLDDRGYIKEGTEVGDGDYLVGIVELNTRYEEKPEIALLRALGSPLAQRYRDRSERLHGYIHGVVKYVHDLAVNEGDTKRVVKIGILMRSPLKEGDKLAGRHGNKGIVAKIEDDDDMPITPDGKTVEMIYSPLAIPSRKNLGQLYEAHAGLIAEKKRERGEKDFVYKTFNFDKNDSKGVLDGLKEIGIPDGKMKLVIKNKVTGEPEEFENPVTVGNMYVLKLKHKVDDKLQARHIGKVDPRYQAPRKSHGQLAGDKANPQRFGEMEMRAMQANKAVWNILESSTIKSDGAGDITDRQAIYDILSKSSDPPSLYSLKPRIPESFRALSSYTKALGLNVHPFLNGKKGESVEQRMSMDDKFNELLILPAKEEEIKRWAPKAVTQERDFRSGAKGEDVPEKNGIFDIDIFGSTEEEQRMRWGRIELSVPMPNPLFMRSSTNPYAYLLGLGPQKVQEIMTKKVGVVIEPGDSGLKRWQVVESDILDKLKKDGKNFNYEIGGHAIQAMLATVDVADEVKKTTDALQNPKINPKDRDFNYKKARILRMLVDNRIKPTDLMMKQLPVLPVALRPRTAVRGGGRPISDDMNRLYKDFIAVNNGMRGFMEAYRQGGRAERDRWSSEHELYDKLERVMGVNTKRTMIGNQEYKGIMDKLSGKEGLIRDRLLSKILDYSGRSVITVNPHLKMGEIGLPYDIAKVIYRPFIRNELFYTGKARSLAEAEEKIDKFDDESKKALHKLVDAGEHDEKLDKIRPVLLNRAPSLHRFSIMAFKPQLVSGRSIELNPLVVTGFNADFDGDQMGVHLPISEEARKEALKLMLPTKNLINPTNGEIIVPLKNEMLLGLYYLTLDKYKGKILTEKQVKHAYGTVNDIWNDYRYNGKLKAHDIVKFNGVIATVGHHLFNAKLPQKYRDYKKNININNKSVHKIIRQILDDKDLGPTSAVQVLDDLKELGFYAATKSGLSFSLADFREPENQKEVISKSVEAADELARKDPSKIWSAYLEAQEILEGKDPSKYGLTDLYQKGIKADPELWKNTLGENNPVWIAMQSGGKGNPEQVRKMTSLVGLGKDITGKILPPILSSHKEGLKPHEFWIHSFDSRRGMADRSLSTAEPGHLTRLIWSSTQDVMITERDCGDDEGVFISRDNPQVIGRYLARPVRSDGKVVYRKGTEIDNVVFDGLKGLKDVESVYIRSPLTCKAEKGVCQVCYGWVPGTHGLPTIGEPVGVLASQAIGEPTAQMTMKTFHAGGVSAKQDDVTAGFPRIWELANISESPKGKSEVSPYNGIIREIKDGVVNVSIFIAETDENGQIISKKPREIRIPLSKKESIIIKPGDRVIPGQQLTSGTFNPYDKLKHEGIRSAQTYLVDELNRVLNDSDRGAGLGIDRKHLELTVSSLTDKVTLTNTSTHPSWLVGQTVQRNQVDKWNHENIATPIDVDITTTPATLLVGARAGKDYRDNTGNIIVKEHGPLTEEAIGRILTLRVHKIRVYPKPIKYSQEMYGVTINPLRGSGNWFSQLGFQHIDEPMARGAVFGEKDKLEDPRSRTMAGKMLNVGEGFKNWVEGKADSIVNLFR